MEVPLQSSLNLTLSTFQHPPPTPRAEAGTCGEISEQKTQPRGPRCLTFRKCPAEWRDTETATEHWSNGEQDEEDNGTVQKLSVPWNLVMGKGKGWGTVTSRAGACVPQRDFIQFRNLSDYPLAKNQGWRTRDRIVTSTA